MAYVLLASCSDSGKPVAQAPPSAPPRTTQLYAPQPTISLGESGTICYGVENAKSVTLSPPVQELSAALARCVEVQPKTRTTYTLTAQGADGKSVSQDIAIEVGSAKAKIDNVNISAVNVKPGERVSICYTASNALEVTITPPGYHGPNGRGCAMQHPTRTTTYTIVARGASGDRDQEQVTVNVH